jgi:hypothetical protein
MRVKENQTSKILRVLKTNRYVYNTDLNKICFRYGGRIFELRREGHNIQKEYVKPGVFKYWLVPERTYEHE